jgi:dihydroflavonol-4-reductase
MTVVVTGATGHVGANLVRALVAQGRPVRCLVHNQTAALEGLNVELVRGDVCDVESLYSTFLGADVVYHLAAVISLSMSDWPRVEKINVGGPRNVIEACRRAGVRRLVHFSSIHAYAQDPLSVPIDESRAMSGSNKCPPYDRSKCAGELLVREAVKQGLNAVIINPTAVLGPYDFGPSHQGQAIIAIAQNTLPALVTGGFDWVDVRDVVAGAMRAEATAPTGSRYLLSGHWASVCDMAQIIGEITGTVGKKFVCPLWLARAGAPVMQGLSRMNGKRPLYTSVSLKDLQSNKNISHAKAARELGYEPRPFRETLEDTLRWFKENGKLA